MENLPERIDAESEAAYLHLRGMLKLNRLQAVWSLLDAIQVISENHQEGTIEELAATAKRRIEEIQEDR